MTTKKSPKKKPAKKKGGSKKPSRTRAIAKRNDDVTIGPTFDKDLPVEIDSDDIRTKEKRLAKAEHEKRQQMDAMNAEVAPRRAEIKNLQKEIDGLVASIADGTEIRPVPCHEERDYKRNVIRTIREDTDREVPELARAMTAEDREMSFDELEEKDGSEEDDNDEAEDPGEDPEMAGGGEDDADSVEPSAE